MANPCETTITVVGLQEEPEAFVKALSKVMFRINLDDLDPTDWGVDADVDGKTWYTTLLDEYHKLGATKPCILYLKKPYEKLGVTAPCFYVETKWKTPMNEVREASRIFPELIFHANWWLFRDGPTGEFVMNNGQLVEDIERVERGCLFDGPVLHPTVSLLPAHLKYSLAQRGTLRLNDAIQTIEDLRQILDDRRFTDSPCQAYRDLAEVERTRKTLDALLNQMRDTSKQLTFQGVFVNDLRCETLYDSKEQDHTGPVGDYQRRADEERKQHD